MASSSSSSSSSLLLIFMALTALCASKCLGKSERVKHIVYMGSSETPGSTKLLNNLLGKMNGAEVVQVYQHAFNGFVARMTKAQATQLKTHPGVVSVFPDPILRPFTTRSWDFLRVADNARVEPSDYNGYAAGEGADVIIGILDTGIWPESESFNDRNMASVPSRWKGECMIGPDFNSSSCNRKLIGARYYKKSMPTAKSPRDHLGHGTHVASTAAGIPIHNASFYGIAAGTARGIALASHIASYKVCELFDCFGSAILAAFDDAIKDGVDILSLSVGNDEDPKTILEDPIAIGALHAVQKGITVISAAGNSGPNPYSVNNSAPWMITVGATSIDRFFESRVKLGNKRVFMGQGINLLPLKQSPEYELIDGTKNETSICRSELKNDGNRPQVKGKVVMCNFADQFSLNRVGDRLQSIGVVGLIAIVDKLESEATISDSLPVTKILSTDGVRISNYIKSSRNPTATILATRTVLSHKPAPVIPDFSPRGPARDSPNLIKPDIVAPGVQILASWIANDSDITLPGKTAPLLSIRSGTSMACPHVSGIVAVIKSQRPNWSPAIIRSAIMTTAIQSNNLNESIETESGKVATPYDLGAGLVSRTRWQNPGLVYEMGLVDYYHFFCYIGYNTSTIKLVAGTLPRGFSCPDASKDEISNLNYPSIAVSHLVGQRVTVIRSLTMISTDDERLYTVSVEAPPSLDVVVDPKTLHFTRHQTRLNYTITFSSLHHTTTDTFGAISWTSGVYNVRTPFVVSSLS